MDLSHILPAYQPLPFPLPVWLIQILLVVGFYLHAIPMNVILGGGFLSAVLFFIGSKDKTSYAYRAATIFANGLPIFISFAITQGIVPLLFIQLLYGPAFYTSSILLSIPWLSLIFVLLVSYYISYLVIYRILAKESDTNPGTKAAIALLIMALGFTFVGFMFSNNTTLMLTPEKWLPMYQTNAIGLHLNLKEPQLPARFIHFFLAALAVAGLALGCVGLYLQKKEQSFASWLIKMGSRITLVITIIQIPVGLWFLKSIPSQYAAMFMGKDLPATAVFGASVVLVLLAIVASQIGAITGSKRAFMVNLHTNLLLIFLMIINRHQLRLFYLNPHLKPEAIPVSTQWDLLTIFLVSTVGLIFYLIWLSRLTWSAYHPKSSETANFTV